MIVRPTFSQKNDHNLALEIYRHAFEACYTFYEHLGDVEEIMKSGFSENLDNWPKLPRLYIKVPFAIKALVTVLRRPPTIAEIAEVANEREKKIDRFLSGEHKRYPPFLPFNVSFEKASKFGYVRCLFSDEKFFVQKRVGKGYGEDEKDSGPSSRFVIPLKVPFDYPFWANVELKNKDGRQTSMVERTPLNDEDKRRLREYLASPPYIDLFRRFMKRSVTVSLKMVSQEVLKLAHKLYSPLGERAINVAKRNDSIFLTEEIIKHMSFKWMLSIPQEEAVTALRKSATFFNDLSNEELASIINTEEEIKDGLVVDVKGGTYLICSICGCATKMNLTREEIKCQFCPTRYKIRLLS